MNIKSIYCTYDIAIQNFEENKYHFKEIEIAYDGSNIYFLSLNNPVEQQKEVNLNTGSESKNLLELLVKKLYDRGETKAYINFTEAALYNGRLLSCSGTYFPGDRNKDLGPCFEDKNTNDNVNTILAPWISRMSLLHLLGISFIPIQKGEAYWGLLDIPATPKYLYKPLLSVLKENFIKNNIFIEQKGDYHIYLCRSLSTSIWLDNNNDIIKIQQQPFYSTLLKNKKDLHKYTNKEVHEFFNLAGYEYNFGEFHKLPDGTRIPLHIEFIKQTPNISEDDPVMKDLSNKLNELAKQFPVESEEFSTKVKELDLQFISMILQKGMKIELLATINIHPENLIVNQLLNESLFQIKIPNGTIIYQGKEPNGPHYIYNEDASNSDNFTEKYKEQLKIFLFIFFCMGIVLFSIYITKKLFIYSK